MKICRVHYDYPNDSLPGAGVTIFYLCKYIKEKTLFLCKKGKGNNYKVPDHIKLKEYDLNDKESSKSLSEKIHSKKKLNIFQTIYTYFLLIISMRSITFFLKSIPMMISFKPDIIACHENRTIYHGIFCKYFLGSKFVLHLHTNSEIEVIKNIWLLKYFVFKADSIFCLTDDMGKELINELSFPLEKIKYTSTGVNPIRFKNVRNKRKEQLLAIGRFKFTKGYNYLIDAINMVVDHYPNYQLLILGDGPDRKKIEKQIKSLNLTQNIKLPGFVSRDKIVQHMSESKIFVMSSLYEGLPKVLLEALACETPAIITSKCNASHIILGRGIEVEPANSKSLSNAIINLINDENLWKIFSNNCRSICDDYNWEKVAENVWLNYKNILQL
jgi:glycosyltransferase involved in cell wall biosynthesis